MKILLFGSDGQVGWELQRSLAPLGDVIALSPKNNDGLTGDFFDLQGIRATIRAVKPDIIVNAAAYTAVDKAEEEVETVRLINAEAPTVIAEEAAALGALFLHYSTDYVFDGSGQTPWKESDPVNPINVYGRTKNEGDEGILASGCNHLIFRVSWVYSVYGANFIHTMLRLMQKLETIKVVSDQVGVPAGAEFIADASALALQRMRTQPDLSGIYHLVPSGETTWYDFAQFIKEQATKNNIPQKVKDILPIPTKDYPTPAKRPLNSRMDTSKISNAFGLTMPDWREGVSRALYEIGKGLSG